MSSSYYLFLSKRKLHCHRMALNSVFDKIQFLVYSMLTSAKLSSPPQVFVVVGVFFVCFAPFHLARIPYTLSQTRSTSAQCWAQNQLYFAKEMTLWISSTNVCLDPLIYVFLCRVFRKKLTATLSRRPLPHGLGSMTQSTTRMEMPNRGHCNTNLDLGHH